VLPELRVLQEQLERRVPMALSGTLALERPAMSQGPMAISTSTQITVTTTRKPLEHGALLPEISKGLMALVPVT